MKISISGTEEVIRVVKALSEEQLESAVKDTAKKTENRISSKTPVRTGRMKSSIATEAEGNRASVGYGVDYAQYVEFGHRTRSGSYVPGKHMLESTVNEVAGDFVQAVITQLQKDGL